MDENRLNPLPQYHIDRDKLCEIVMSLLGFPMPMNITSFI